MEEDVSKKYRMHWNFLKLAADSGHLAHAYLFSGNDHEGKLSRAIKLFQYVNCTDDQRKPCGTCRTCIAIEKRISPDVTCIGVKEGDKEIKIDAVRKLIAYLSLAPYESFVKGIIIEHAHLMNYEAQSAFLKLLEEPKGVSLIILLAEYPALLLPTIISRVQELPFYRYNYPFPTDAKPAIDIMQKLKNAPLFERFAFAKKISENPEKMHATLSYWLLQARKEMLEALTQQEYATMQYWKRIARILEEVISYIQRTNVNSKLALERIMIEL